LIHLLETKLYVPKSRSGLVSRPRLIEHLRVAAERKLTLVIGPAGFGKTTLLAEWISDRASGNRAAGWVSLDPTENDPALFVAYVTRALQKIRADVGTHAISLLQSPEPPMEAVLTTLINEISGLDFDFFLVLDDYHVIDAAPVHAALTFLLDHLPPRMHVVLASRSDPPLPLARLRARGELAEVRVAELRFTLEEASAFLNQVMALDLSATDTATLEQRTEGWITGLKLAALSMKGRQDVRGFVDAFAGDNRYIAEYLVEEVLNAEPERTRRFLKATAILDRLSGPLCDAVTAEAGSQALLESLDRRGLFVVALDERREWFRYHHLFADVLQAQSVREDPDRARTFHLRASAWYEEHDSPAAAVRHALAGGDLERAAGLLETTWPERNRSYQSRTWLEQVKALPDALVRVRPVLGMGYAWALLNSGELEAAEPRLRDVERWLATTADGSERTAPASTEMVVSDARRFRSLPSELASARIYLTQALGGVPGTVEHAERALDLIPEGDHAARATGIALLALALWARGDLEAAHGTFAEALATMRRAGHALDAIRGTFVLGDIRVAQGRLREAATIYERGLKLAMEEAHPAPAETDELYLGLSEVHREWGDLEAAAGFLQMMTELVGRAAHVGNRQRWCTAMARVSEARGELDRALALLDEAETHDRRTPLPRVQPIAAMKARIWILQGRVAEAMSWARERQLSPEDDLGYLREFEHITLARVLLARYGSGGDERSIDDAVRLLDRLRTAAEDGGRMGSVIEILALQSLAEHALGNVRRALDPLARALGVAEPEGYLRVFLDEGSRMRELLRHATARGLAGEYARKVLSAFDAPRQPVVASSRVPAPGPAQSLTTRELEILRLIAAGLRNQEIADHLAISAATVKRHIANAYGKLGAGHRTEALVRAKELKLL
jgi:LuxR family maltose regulon positive regulatory protein